MIKKVAFGLTSNVWIGLFLLSRKDLFINAFAADKFAMSFPQELEQGCLSLNYHRVPESEF